MACAADTLGSYFYLIWPLKMTFIAVIAILSGLFNYSRCEFLDVNKTIAYNMCETFYYSI